MFQNLKSKVCLTCPAELVGITSKYSSKRYCEECYKERRRVAARKHYANGQPESRRLAAERQKQRVKDSDQYRLFLSAKHRARQVGLEFNIKQEDIVVPEVCPVFKIPFIKNSEYTASIDRIDSTKGYVKGNIQILSWKANTMKSNASEEELNMFADWIKTRTVNLPKVPEFKE